MKSSQIERITGLDLIHGDEARVLSCEECPGQACSRGGRVCGARLMWHSAGHVEVRWSKGLAGSGLVIAYRLKIKTSV